MKMTTKVFTWLLAVMVVFMAVPTFAVELCVGREGGGYWNWGQKLQRALMQNSIEIELVPTLGTLDALSKLENGDCDLALAQLDGIGENVQALPVVDAYLEPILLVSKGDSRSDRVTDLKKGSIAVGPVGSGTAMTFSNWVKQNPKQYEAVLPKNFDGPIAAGQLAAGQVDAIMAVTSFTSDTLRDWLNRGFKFIDINDSKLDDMKSFTGDKLYRRVKLKDNFFKDANMGHVADLFRGGKMWFLMVPAMLVASNEYALDPDNYNEFSTVSSAAASIAQAEFARLNQTDWR